LVRLLRDPAPPRRDHHGAPAVRPGRGRRRDRGPFRLRRLCGPDDRDRPHAAHARSPPVRREWPVTHQSSPMAPLVSIPLQESAMKFAVHPLSLRSLAAALGLLALAGCASSGGANMSTVAPNPDPRVGLRAGLMNAATASSNMRLLSS